VTQPAPFDLDAIGAGLPVAAARGRLEAAVRTGALVVTAPPGTGKTTFVPPLAALSTPGRVVVVQPRRVAVRAAARRLAHLAGEAGRGAVGFTVRGESTSSAVTRVEFVTPGILLRRLLADASLDGVGAVVLDEVHERSLDGDLLLGMLTEARQLRDDLVLAAMSATLDADAVAALIGAGSPAPVVDVPSPLHALTLTYAPYDGDRMDRRGVTSGFRRHVARLAVDAQRTTAADALVFVPSARDVDEVVREVRGLSPALDVLPLHGQLSPREQDAATAGRSNAADPARIVISTALAESSLTVPGVRAVIDTGLSREPRRDAGRGVAGLITTSASRASAEQRAGRAAREAPGIAVRAYSETDFARMPADVSPAIRSADLTDAALLLAAWGTPRGEGLPLLTMPPAQAMDAAIGALETLGLVDASGRTTPLGARVAGMPAGAREARALLAAADEGVEPRDAADVVAALSGGHRDAGADLARLLRELGGGRSPAAARWRADAKRLSGIAGARRGGRAPGTDAPVAPASAAPGIVTALARPEWIARRVASGSREYLLASGTRAALPEESSLRHSEWLAVWEAQRAPGLAGGETGSVIRLAAPLTESDALRLGHALRRRERTAVLDGGRVRVREESRLGAIVLSATPVAATRADTAPALAAHVRAAGIGALTWSRGAEALRARLGLLHRTLGAPWPDVSDDALLATLDDWLLPALGSAGGSLAGIDLAGALRGLLPWPEASRLDALAPERLAVPSGAEVRIDYPEPDDPAAGPVVAVKLQEAFGLSETPRLVDGRVPVVFHLLSPARRPLAVTADLAGFWNGAYGDVRKEMRGRYPKHPWPEDPWTAPATAKTNRALRG